MIRTLLHRGLLMVAMLPLLLAFFSLGLFTVLAVAADKVLPDARWGNCWTYSVPRWRKHGGYLGLRDAEDILVLGRYRVPHSVWQPWPGVLRMTAPLRRKAARWLPLHALLFPFEVRREDHLRPTTWKDSAPPST